MNLNNKKLAIGLSIVAVLTVTYQVFFNKTDQPKRAVPQPNVPAYVAPTTTPNTTPATTSTTTAANPQTPAVATDPSINQTDSNDNGLIIDFHSEILLKRIPFELAQPAPPREIEPEYGNPIFTKPKELEPAPASTEPVKEVEFVLNGIIIDSTRRIAIINDTILKEGDMILGATITTIAKNKVTLKINQQNIILSTESKIQKIKLSGGTGDH